jgi:hypothetical protein
VINGFPIFTANINIHLNLSGTVNYDLGGAKKVYHYYRKLVNLLGIKLS